MKKVLVRPERCVGCLQCMIACATAHSQSRIPYLAAGEKPTPKPRIYVGAGLLGEGFPNRCRHCDPAPCQAACLPGAIFRDKLTETILIDADRCINCGSCAMACPFGVIRYYEIGAAAPGRSVAVKCDNCLARQAQGLIPACVAACQTGALIFDEFSHAMKQKTHQVAKTMSVEQRGVSA